MRHLALVGVLLCCTSFPAQAGEPVPSTGHGAAHREHAVPHSFLLPRGMPDAVGSYNVQISPFLHQKDGVSKLDVGGHFSYGMFDWGGIHLRSLGARTGRNLEVIAMGSLHRDEHRANGVSLLAILAIPTNKGADADAHHGLGYLLGAAAHNKLSEDISMDSTLHYDFTAKHLIPELGIVAAAAQNWFVTFDASASIGTKPELALLPGVKHRAFSGGFIGLGYRQPILSDSPFDRQVYLQLEIGRH